MSTGMTGFEILQKTQLLIRRSRKIVGQELAAREARKEDLAVIKEIIRVCQKACR